MIQFETPILFLIFNRPETTLRVFETLKVLQPKFIFVAADGPRATNGEYEKCMLTRTIVGKIDWDCDVRTLFRETNLGCGHAVSGAINWFFEHVDEGIILEDDTLPHPDFFKFCGDMLIKYRHDHNIWSINGCNLGYELDNGKSYGFTRFMNMWGWATWKRSAKLVDYEFSNWNRAKNKFRFISPFIKRNMLDFDKLWVNYWVQAFNKTSSGLIDTWDYQWICSQLVNKKYSIFPARNLVINIGFDQNATHTPDPNHLLAKLEFGPLSLPYNHPSKITLDKVYEDRYIKEIWCSHKRMPVGEYIKGLAQKCYKAVFLDSK